MEKTTLDDIALKAGVTKSTVSKALRHASDINRETAEKIRRLAIKMGYIPESSAPNRNSKQVGLGNIHLAFYQLSPSFVHSENYLSRITHLLQERFANHHTLLFESYPQTPADFERLLTSNQADALLLLGNFKAFDDSVLLSFKRFLAEHKPVLLLCNYLPKEEKHFFSIRADDFTAGWQAAQYCIEQGYTRIAFVQAFAWQAVVTDRRYGYQKALEEQGLTPSILSFPYETNNFTDLDKLTTLLQKPGPVALVFDGDGTAIRIAKRLKNQMPEAFPRLHFVGINGAPDLTPDDGRHATVKLDMEAIADQTISYLEQIAQGAPIQAGRILVGSKVITAQTIE